MMLKQYQQYGEVSNGMILICIFQLLYVVDALWSEVHYFHLPPINIFLLLLLLNNSSKTWYY